MKQFFKMMFASMLGTVILLLLVLLISVGIISALVASASSEEISISRSTLLHLKLNKPIVDRSSNVKFTMGMAGPEHSTGLNEILDNLKKAKTDDNISGIYLDLTDIQAGLATVNEIRDGLNDFKTSGKFIWAYSEAYSQKSYYLASMADKVFLHPEGMVEFKGLSSEMAFIRGLLEKLDIKMQIIRHGKFKAATEPLFLDKMSAENREQITRIISNIWNDMAGNIATDRQISVAAINRIADSLLLQTPADAKKMGFVDELVYKDQLIDSLRKQLKISQKETVKMVSLDDYSKVSDPNKNYKSPDKIAVIYASGSIGSGEGDDESIGSERISKAIRKAREDDKVKAIVFRINSGGGSALASDVIWREIDLAKKVKPVVSSFGDVAASGGYYIACASSKILADPSTITGSIGVFGVIPNMEGLFAKKLGITFDRAMTNKNGDYIPIMKPLTPYQEKLIQKEVDNIYLVFTTKVAEGRSMKQENVDSIGQGRVWSGNDAKVLNLIDDFGGLSRSVEMAAELAGLKDYRIISLPEQKEWFEELIDQFSGKNSQAGIREVLGDDYRLYQYVKEIRSMEGVQARMLMDIEIK